MAGNGTSPFYVGNTSCKGRSISHCYFSLPECMQHMGVSLKWWYPQIIHFNGGFHYFHHPFWGTATILGTPHICRYKIPNELRNAHGVFWRTLTYAPVCRGRPWHGHGAVIKASFDEKVTGQGLWVSHILLAWWLTFLQVRSKQFLGRVFFDRKYQVRVDDLFSEYIIVDWYFYVGGSADPRNIT